MRIGISKKAVTFLMAAVILTSFAVAGCSKNNNVPEKEESLPAWENPLKNPRPDSDYKPTVEDPTEKLKDAQAQNSDSIGWLQIPGTDIDEVVVQSTDNEFYYRRDALKNYSFSGSLWMDYENKLGDGTANALPQNTIIYGHNLGNPQGVKDDPQGVKFAQLFKFDDLEFAKAHPYFYFTTDSGTHIYEIFTVFYSEDQLSPVPYHHPSFTASDYEKLIADVRNRSQFDYNVEFSPDDKIMSLSTCTYKYGTYSQNPHQRFVIMGRLMNEDDNFYETADIQVNPDPKEPNFSKK